METAEKTVAPETLDGSLENLLLKYRVERARQASPGIVDETGARLVWMDPTSRISMSLLRYGPDGGEPTQGDSVTEIGEGRWLAGGPMTTHATFDDARAAAEKWATEELPKLLAAK